MLLTSMVVYAVGVDIDSDGTTSVIESVVGNILLISVFIGAVIAIWKFIVAGKKLSNNIDQFFSDWSGEPAREGVEARPGILSRLHTLEDLRNEQSETLRNLSEQITVLSKHVNAELNRNGGSSTKDAAHEALRVAKEIQAQQEKDAKTQREWHRAYLRDRDNMRAEWEAFFGVVTKMIPLPPEEQAAMWEEVTEAYSEGTILTKPSVLLVEEDPETTSK